MEPRDVRTRLAAHLRVLVEDIGARPPGSSANRRATDHVHAALPDTGMQVNTFPSETRWWEPGQGRLTAAGLDVPVAPDPYSSACEVEGTAVPVGSLRELETLTDPPGRILVLRGGLTRQPLLPGAFPFASSAEHHRILAAIEAARPRAGPLHHHALP